MCSDCHLVHSKFPVGRWHTVLRGSSMPQSQADKPPKFDYCDSHTKLLKDEFCSEHKILICSSCSSTNHNKCFIKSVDSVCKTVNISEIDVLYNNIKTMQDQARSVHSLLETNVEKLAERKKTILEKTQTVYDKIISKVNKLFKDLQSEIETTYLSQELLISQQQERIDLLIKRYESVLTDSEKFKGKPIDTKLFLKIQDLVTDTRQISDEFRAFHKSLCLISITFKPGLVIQDFLLSSATLGSVSKSEAKYDKDIVLKDIVFPCSQYKPPKAVMVPPPQTNLSGMSPPVPLSRIKATKHDTHNLKLKDDKSSCAIYGLAITKDRKRIVVDYGNDKVKLFSHKMKNLSSVSIPDRPWDIAIISDREAVVTTANKSLVILDISGSQLRIKKTTQLSYNVRGISSHKKKLVVTSPSNEPASVKLIDQNGKVYWSVSSDQQGQPLFRSPYFVSSHGGGRSSTVIVSDEALSTLLLLNADNGEVITKRHIGMKYLEGITTDFAGNVYVCIYDGSEVSVMSGDLSEEKILLSGQDGLTHKPHAIVYDHEANQLIIANSSPIGSDQVDVFQLL